MKKKVLILSVILAIFGLSAIPLLTLSREKQKTEIVAIQPENFLSQLKPSDIVELYTNILTSADNLPERELREEVYSECVFVLKSVQIGREFRPVINHLIKFTEWVGQIRASLAYELYRGIATIMMNNQLDDTAEPVFEGIFKLAKRAPSAVSAEDVADTLEFMGKTRLSQDKKEELAIKALDVAKSYKDFYSRCELLRLIVESVKKINLRENDKFLKYAVQIAMNEEGFRGDSTPLTYLTYVAAISGELGNKEDALKLLDKIFSLACKEGMENRVHNIDDILKAINESRIQRQALPLLRKIENHLYGLKEEVMRKGKHSNLFDYYSTAMCELAMAMWAAGFRSDYEKIFKSWFEMMENVATDEKMDILYYTALQAVKNGLNEVALDIVNKLQALSEEGNRAYLKGLACHHIGKILERMGDGRSSSYFEKAIEYARELNVGRNYTDTFHFFRILEDIKWEKEGLELLKRAFDSVKSLANQNEKREILADMLPNIADADFPSDIKEAIAEESFKSATHIQNKEERDDAVRRLVYSLVVSYHPHSEFAIKKAIDFTTRWGFKTDKNLKAYLLGEITSAISEANVHKEKKKALLARVLDVATRIRDKSLWDDAFNEISFNMDNIPAPLPIPNNINRFLENIPYYPREPLTVPLSAFYDAIYSIKDNDWKDSADAVLNGFLKWIKKLRDDESIVICVKELIPLLLQAKRGETAVPFFEELFEIIKKYKRDNYNAFSDSVPALVSAIMEARINPEISQSLIQKAKSIVKGLPNKLWRDELSLYLDISSSLITAKDKSDYLKALKLSQNHIIEKLKAKTLEIIAKAIAVNGTIPKTPS
jgi:hypothetical protein